MTDHDVYIPDKRVEGQRGKSIARPFPAAKNACTTTWFTAMLPQNARGHLYFEKPCDHLNVEENGDKY